MLRALSIQPTAQDSAFLELERREEQKRKARAPAEIRYKKPRHQLKSSSDFLETIRPPPRAQCNRKQAQKSDILADTPEKKALEEKRHIKEMKKRNMSVNNQYKGGKKIKQRVKGKIKESKAKGDRKINKDEKVEKVKKKILK
ncbi:unnamed protein product [Parnassius apollo]|uniref:(apollo) hypothetical protein n=1 Tax=Parnassius apollo TaxID=110799 RepID=A0A8S3WCR6_PARAO|nr:unnamed protein product [Parnassius apollo]